MADRGGIATPQGDRSRPDDLDLAKVRRVATTRDVAHAPQFDGAYPARHTRSDGATTMSKNRLSKSTCLHCVFMDALRRKWKGRKNDAASAKVDLIVSALKISRHAFMMMTVEEQTQFIKDLSTPPPSIHTVLDALKAVFEQAGAKVTEH
jgi:hypothetical protein